MADFQCTCLRCEAEFTEAAPRVFCPPCRPLAAGEMAKANEEALVKFYLEHPDAPMPGDTVRRRTDDDRAFERAVMADVDGLP